MSCRWSRRGRPATTLDQLAGVSPGSLAMLVELARARRKDDFRWLARSQGVLGDDVEALWDGLLARTCPDPPAPAG